jgi:hypothetical protein
MDTLIRIVAVVMIALLFPCALWADEARIEHLALLTSFAMIDYSQSEDMFFGRDGYHEVNPVLGQSPTRQDLLLFGAVGLCLSYALTEILPSTWKLIVMDSIIATEKMNIEENRTVYKGWNTEGPPLRGRTMDGIPIMVSLRF